MKTNKANLVILPSVGCMMDQETLDTFPCPKSIPLNVSMIYDYGEVHVWLKNCEVDMDEAVAFENVTDEWLDKLSAFDLKKILYLIRDNSTKYRINISL